MKKRIVAMVLCVSMGIMMLAGCGDKKETAPAKETNENVTETQISTSEEQTQNVEAKGNGAGGYAFTFSGVTFEPDMDASVVVEALGEPLGYFEAKSCAFEGLDKIYTYSSVQIETYPLNDMDLISMIVLMDDLVSTPEGAYIGMTLDQVTALYGEQEIVDGILSYEKGNMRLKFVFDNETVVSIEYDSKALDL